MIILLLWQVLFIYLSVCLSDFLFCFLHAFVCSPRRLLLSAGFIQHLVVSSLVAITSRFLSPHHGYLISAVTGLIHYIKVPTLTTVSSLLDSSR